MQASQSAGPLMVWVDSTRVSAAQAFQRAHPNVKLNIVTYDGNANGADTLPTKVGLYDRTRSGWPDVVFSATDNETSWAVAAGFTAPPNQGQTPWATPEQLCQRLPGPCTVNGKVYCLRNDLPQVVLWYNASLIKKWSYQVPTTWSQYEQPARQTAITNHATSDGYQVSP